MASRYKGIVSVRCDGNIPKCSKYVSLARTLMGVADEANKKKAFAWNRNFQTEDGLVEIRCQKTRNGDGIIRIYVPISGSCVFDIPGIYFSTAARYYRFDRVSTLFVPYVVLAPEPDCYISKPDPDIEFTATQNTGQDSRETVITNSNTIVYGDLVPDVLPWDVDLKYDRSSIIAWPPADIDVYKHNYYVSTGRRVRLKTYLNNKFSIEDSTSLSDNTLGIIIVRDSLMTAKLLDNTEKPKEDGGFTLYVFEPDDTQFRTVTGILTVDVSVAHFTACEKTIEELELELKPTLSFDIDISGGASADTELYLSGIVQGFDTETIEETTSLTASKSLFITRQDISTIIDEAIAEPYFYYYHPRQNGRGSSVKVIEIISTVGVAGVLTFSGAAIHTGNTYVPKPLLTGSASCVKNSDSTSDCTSTDYPDPPPPPETCSMTWSGSSSVDRTANGNLSCNTVGGSEYALKAGYYEGQVNILKATFTMSGTMAFSKTESYDFQKNWSGSATSVIHAAQMPGTTRTEVTTINNVHSSQYSAKSMIISDSFDTLGSIIITDGGSSNYQYDYINTTSLHTTGNCTYNPNPCIALGDGDVISSSVTETEIGSMSENMQSLQPTFVDVKNRVYAFNFIDYEVSSTFELGGGITWSIYNQIKAKGVTILNNLMETGSYEIDNLEGNKFYPPYFGSCDIDEAEYNVSITEYPKVKSYFTTARSAFIEARAGYNDPKLKPLLEYNVVDISIYKALDYGPPAVRDAAYNTTDDWDLNRTGVLSYPCVLTSSSSTEYKDEADLDVIDTAIVYSKYTGATEYTARDEDAYSLFVNINGTEYPINTLPNLLALGVEFPPEITDLPTFNIAGI